MRVVIFDVDGTLVDSQGDIIASMRAAFGGLGLDAPSDEAIRQIVGLSLPEAMVRLAPEADTSALVEGYKRAYMTLRAEKGAEQSSPLFPGARAALDRLRGEDETLLAVATGKSRRGLDKLIEGHRLEGYFFSEQCADHHPSKPHPSMIEAVLRDTGLEAAQAVVIGDTSFDMEMARAAGVRCIGVSWGYHPVSALNADLCIDDFEALGGALNTLLPEEATL